MIDTVSPEEGKFYRTRDGERAGPAKPNADSLYAWTLETKDALRRYLSDGRWYDDFVPNAHDLIAEWVEPCPLGQHHRGADDNCTICGATPDQVNAQAREQFSDAMYVAGEYLADRIAGDDPEQLEIVEEEVKTLLADDRNDIKAHIADEAKRIVSGARRSAYGTPEANFARIARLWDAYMKNSGRDVTITAADVSPMMALMKIARLGETPAHYDSIVDLVGYALTMAEVNGVKIPE